MTMKFSSLTGNSQRLDGGAMFGNVPRAMWEKWIAPDEQHRIPLACRCLLVEDLDGKTVLFEAGIGAFFDPKLKARFGVLEDRHVLLDSLAELGLDHTDIDAVVLSHLHFDHAGGLLAAWQPDTPPSLLFPKARFLIGRAHWDRAKVPHPRDRASFVPELIGLLEASGRVELVDGETSSLGPGVRFRYSDGHTPGLMLAEIGESGGMVYCADLIPGRPWVHLPVTMGYDRAPEILIDEKRRFLDAQIDAGRRLFFTHDPDCALATPSCDSKGRYGTLDPLATLTRLPLGAVPAAA